MKTPILAVVLCVLTISESAIIFQKCDTKSPDLNDCMARNVERALKFYANGYAKLNIPPLDPVKIPTDNFPSTLIYRDLRVQGLSDFNTVKTNIDLKNWIIAFETTNPAISFLASDRIEKVPSTGHDFTNITYVNVKLEHRMVLKLYEKKGESYGEVSEYGITLTPEKVLFDLAEAPGGNAEVVKSQLNKNWEDTRRKHAASYEKAFAEGMKRWMNILSSYVPISTLYDL